MENTQEVQQPKKQGRPAVWTPETILAKAQQFKTLKEFRENVTSAYQAARKLDLLEQVTQILEVGKRGRKPKEVPAAE